MTKFDACCDYSVSFSISLDIPASNSAPGIWHHIPQRLLLGLHFLL